MLQNWLSALARALPTHCTLPGSKKVRPGQSWRSGWVPDSKTSDLSSSPGLVFFINFFPAIFVFCICWRYEFDSSRVFACTAKLHFCTFENTIISKSSLFRVISRMGANPGECCVFTPPPIFSTESLYSCQHPPIFSKKLGCLHSPPFVFVPEKKPPVSRVSFCLASSLGHAVSSLRSNSEQKLQGFWIALLGHAINFGFNLWSVVEFK